MARKSTKAIRVAGDVVSVTGGAWVAHYLEIPNGLPPSSFLYGCAPIAALAGYEIGRAIALRVGWHLVLSALFGLAIVPVAFFLYYYLLNTAEPGIGSVAAIYLSFAATFFSLFCAFGLLQVHIFPDR